MNPDLQESLFTQLLAMADDELILGQRDAEWCGHAPILEEDIAFANIALDEIGHAGLWYGVIAGALGEDRDTYPDRLVYERAPEQFRNAPLLELPPGDWAFTILRQYIFDALETCRLESLIMSQYRPIAEVAEKVRKEETYHLRHSEAWMKRLGLGTEESHRRMQDALDALWGYTPGLFSPPAGEEKAIEAGFFPPGDRILKDWSDRVRRMFELVELRVPAGSTPAGYDRFQHTRHHHPMILEMQSVVRQYPEASW